MNPFLLRTASAVEAAGGLALLAHPPIVVRLLLDSDIAGAGVVMSRIAGIALIALAIACWPGGKEARGTSGALPAILCYNLFASLYFAYHGIGGEQVGSLLWPATAIHVVLTVLLARMWVRGKKAPVREH